MTVFRRGDKVITNLGVQKVLNPIYSGDGKLIGYRVTDGRRPAFWSIVPAYAVEDLQW